MSAEQRRPGLEERTKLRWPEGSVTRLVTDSLHANPDITIINESFSLPEFYPSHESVDFIVSPNSSVYQSGALQEILDGLVPLTPQRYNRFSGSLEEGMRLGENTFYDPVATIRETVIPEITIFDPTASKRLGVPEERPAVIYERTVKRAVSVRVYPNAIIGDWVAQYERSIQKSVKKGIPLAEGDLETLRSELSLDRIARVAEHIEQHGDMLQYLEAVENAEVPFAADVPWYVKDTILTRIKRDFSVGTYLEFEKQLQIDKFAIMVRDLAAHSNR